MYNPKQEQIEEHEEKQEALREQRKKKDAESVAKAIWGDTFFRVDLCHTPEAAKDLDNDGAYNAAAVRDMCRESVDEGFNMALDEFTEAANELGYHMLHHAILTKMKSKFEKNAKTAAI